MHIPFNSLKKQLAPEEAELRAAFERVLERGWYLMGPEVEAFESEFSAWVGTKHTVAVNNGTDAITLALSALGLEPGDEVILPSHTAPPCYHAIVAAGLVPVFAEVEEDYYTLDPKSAAEAVTEDTKAILAVHLYGQMCDMDGLKAVCDKHGLHLIEDCAQAHGAKYKGAMAGSIAPISAFSFYPTKNLGALGDGGAVCCRDEKIRDQIRLLRQYGENPRYVCVRPGVNTRMDEMQAAFLRERLKRLDAALDERRRLAALYADHLAETPLALPKVRANCEHVYHLFVVRSEERDELARHLKGKGIGTAVHYPVPGHRQPMFSLDTAPCGGVEGLDFTDSLRDKILSLPLYPGMTDADIAAVGRAIREFYGS